MKTLIATLIALSTLTSVAVAAPRKAKPAVCVDYEVAETKGGRIGVCYDGKKPAVFNMFSLVDVNAGDEENPTKTVRVLVGWR